MRWTNTAGSRKKGRLQNKLLNEKSPAEYEALKAIYGLAPGTSERSEIGPGTFDRGEKASPLCQINPRHLKKRSLGERKQRCN